MQPVGYKSLVRTTACPKLTTWVSRPRRISDNQRRRVCGGMDGGWGGPHLIVAGDLLMRKETQRVRSIRPTLSGGELVAQLISSHCSHLPCVQAAALRVTIAGENARFKLTDANKITPTANLLYSPLAIRSFAIPKSGSPSTGRSQWGIASPFLSEPMQVMPELTLPLEPVGPN